MKAEAGQSIIDVAIQQCGSAEAAISLAIVNSVSITDLPDELNEIPAVVDSDIATYYANKGIRPATAYIDNSDRLITPAAVVISDEEPDSPDISVLEGQSFLDIAMQTTGDASAAILLALQNNLSITYRLSTSAKLTKVDVINKNILSYYTTKGIRPATGISKRFKIFDYTFDFTFE